MTRLALLGIAAMSCGRINFVGQSGDGGAGSDSGDAAVAVQCNAATRIDDDFEDGIQDAMWGTSYAQGTTSYGENGGDLVLTLQPNSSSFTGYSTSRLYDMRGNRTFAEIAQVPGPGALVGIALQYDLNNYLYIYVQDGMLTASKDVMDTFTLIGNPQVWSATADRFIAIEEQSGQLLFESSPDGITFTTFAQGAEPFDVSLLRTQLYAGTSNPVTAPGVARIASFNRPTAHAGGCPISTLVDTFADGVQGHDWLNSYAAGCCTMTETAGAVHIATTGTAGFAARMSSAGYDLRGDHLTVELPMGPTTSMLGSLRIDLDPNNSIELQVRATTFDVATLVGGTNAQLGTLPRVAGQNYLQIREAGGMLYFEVSSDRASWELLHMIATPFAVDDVRVVLQGGLPISSAADSLDYSNLGGP